eukprot:169501-Rhodomonas_salina.2
MSGTDRRYAPTRRRLRGYWLRSGSYWPTVCFYRYLGTDTGVQPYCILLAVLYWYGPTLYCCEMPMRPEVSAATFLVHVEIAVKSLG